MMLTDDEQKKLNDELLDGPTTQKINKKLSQAEQRILEQLRPVVEKISEHDSFIVDFAKAWNMSIPGVTNFLSKVSGKKR